MIPAVIKKFSSAEIRQSCLFLWGRAGVNPNHIRKSLPPEGGGIFEAGWGIDPALPDTAGEKRDHSAIFNPLQRSVISLTEGSAGGAACGSVSYYEKQKLVCFRISVSLSGSIEPFLILWRCENG